MRRVLVDEGCTHVEIEGLDPADVGAGDTRSAGHDRGHAEEGLALRQRPRMPVGPVGLPVSVDVTVGVSTAGFIGDDEVVERVGGGHGDDVAKLNRRTARDGRPRSGVGRLAVGRGLDEQLAVGGRRGHTDDTHRHRGDECADGDEAECGIADGRAER